MLAVVVKADDAKQPIPASVQAVLDKPFYKSAVWGLQVVDLESGEVLCSKNADKQILVGSIRKMFSVGLALDKLGAGHRFVTPIDVDGKIEQGVLTGNLILVASGDLSMGGRMNPDGTLAISNFDHNEANALGNAELTKPDPLAGYKDLARQVAASGIKEIRGDVIIDDRLFEPFPFRGEFEVRPIFVNDDVVDVMFRPGQVGQPAVVESRPLSAALAIRSSLTTSGQGSELKIECDPEHPACTGATDCQATFNGQLPIDFTPPFTGKWPVVRTVRITQPQNYARTVLIEALKEAGVAVAAATVAENPVQKLPTMDAPRGTLAVASLMSVPYSDYARWILKVSYNIGADTSLLLLGLTQGVNNLQAALQAEQKILQKEFGIAASDYHFVDGSGGGETAITPQAVGSYLKARSQRDNFSIFKAALPSLGVDGSLGFVTDFEKNPALAGAKGNVQAKTGTFLYGDDQGRILLKAQGMAGYITTKTGRRLAYVLILNDAGPIQGMEDLLNVFQDQGLISALLWNEF